jgi:hypothetical protein
MPSLPESVYASVFSPVRSWNSSSSSAEVSAASPPMMYERWSIGYADHLADAPLSLSRRRPL